MSGTGKAATLVILCGPPKDCTCPAVAWTCCCEASEHGRRMIAGLPCDCGLCPATPAVPDGEDAS